jgi:hypothetical protein
VVCPKHSRCDRLLVRAGGYSLFCGATSHWGAVTRNVAKSVLPVWFGFCRLHGAHRIRSGKGVFEPLIQLIVHSLVGRSSFRWLFRMLVFGCWSNFFVIVTLL